MLHAWRGSHVVKRISNFLWGANQEITVRTKVVIFNHFRSLTQMCDLLRPQREIEESITLLFVPNITFSHEWWVVNVLEIIFHFPVTNDYVTKKCENILSKIKGTKVMVNSLW